MGKKSIHFLILASMHILSLPLYAETTECIEITSVPTVITKQGVYCFKKDLSTNITSGNAIDIQANNVTIDFNNFKLGGLAAGIETTATGVYASGMSDIVFRNGNIRGFLFGVELDGGVGNVVEDNLLEANTFVGVFDSGEGSTISGNRVINTGGTAIYSAHGIWSWGKGARILNNDIHNTRADPGDARALIIGSTGAIVKKNRITETSGYSGTFGIQIWEPVVIVEGNIISNYGAMGNIGVHDWFGLGAYCKNNVVRGFISENGGCIDGGGNSFSP